MRVQLFDANVAEICGINAAIIYQHIFYWVQHNAVNGQNYRDGYYWTYNSLKAWSDLIPYLTQKQIRKALSDLEECGLLLSAVFEDTGRTKWYSITEYAERLSDGIMAGAEPVSEVCPPGQNLVPSRALGMPSRAQVVPSRANDVPSRADHISSIYNIHTISQNITNTDIDKEKEKERESRISETASETADPADEPLTDPTSEPEAPEPKPAKEQKHKHGEYNNVLLTDTEYRKLCDKYPNGLADQRIEVLSAGKELKGYKYKSDYLAVIKWTEKDMKDLNAARAPAKNTFSNFESRGTDYNALIERAGKG